MTKTIRQMAEMQENQSIEQWQKHYQKLLQRHGYVECKAILGDLYNDLNRLYNNSREWRGVLKAKKAVYSQCLQSLKDFQSNLSLTLKETLGTEPGGMWELEGSRYVLFGYAKEYHFSADWNWRFVAGCCVFDLQEDERCSKAFINAGICPFNLGREVNLLIEQIDNNEIQYTQLETQIRIFEKILLDLKSPRSEKLGSVSETMLKRAETYIELCEENPKIDFMEGIYNLANSSIDEGKVTAMREAFRKAGWSSSLDKVKRGSPHELASALKNIISKIQDFPRS